MVADHGDSRDRWLDYRGALGFLHRAPGRCPGGRLVPLRRLGSSRCVGQCKYPANARRTSHEAAWVGDLPLRRFLEVVPPRNAMGTWHRCIETVAGLSAEHGRLIEMRLCEGEQRLSF